MKPLSWILFVAYLVVLLWLVLFKFSYDPVSVIRDLHVQKVNLVPFSYTQKGEAIANVLVLVPFGVLLGVIFKHADSRKKLVSIFAVSVAMEIAQFVLSIGVTDITDVIMNTLGGAIGLACYAMLRKMTDEKSLDPVILVMGGLVLLAVLYLRVFVFIVRY